MNYLVGADDKVQQYRQYQECQNIEENQDPEIYRAIFEPSDKENSVPAIYQNRIQRFNDILNKWQSSQFLESNFETVDNEDSDKKDYIGRILAKDNDGNYIINTEQFRNFLQWHNYEHRKMEEAFLEKLPEYRAKFVKDVNVAVENGDLPINALNNLSEIYDLDYILDDGLEGVRDNISGSYMRGDSDRESSVLIAPDCADEYGVFTDESLHAIEGRVPGGYYDPEPESNVYDHWVNIHDKRDYFDCDEDCEADVETENNLRFYRKGIRVLREAACESMSSRLAKTPEKESSYQEEQYLLKQLIELSDGKIKSSELESMFFENDFDKFNQTMDKIIKAFPMVEDIILEIGKIKKWNYSKVPVESRESRLLAAIFGKRHLSGYEEDLPESRFLNNQAYLDYLTDYKSKN